MYNIKLENSVPVPRPATTDRIVAAHYYAAWKKGAAGLHNGFDDLHNFPERTPLCGYYDEEDPNFCDWEIKWALEHGVNCFIYCWYRYKQFQGTPVKREHLRCAHSLHEGLFNAKYGNMMKFALMFENDRRWSNTDPKDMLENLMPYWCDTYFSRDNYLIIDNKPVLFICRHNVLMEGFKDADEQRETFEKCREYAKSYGFDGMYFAAAIWDNNNVKPELYAEYDMFGYDFHFSYNSGYNPPEDTDDDERIINGQLDILLKRLNPAPKKHIPIASCFRDAEPRTTEAWNKLGFNFGAETKYHLSADGFRKVIRRMKNMVDALPEDSWGRRIFMIDNWNEWDEGHYVLPSHEFGFRYLQAIREELTERDNLPDYRMPQDIGLSNFNKSWGNPDLSEECKKKFGIEY